MINFFRRIRHKLIQESQFFKYLKYAIGEIILVVLGILIALQINNWNENQKKELKTINDLLNLKEALNDDIASIDSNLIFNKTRLRGIFYILKHSGLNTQTFIEMKWVDISKNEIENRIWKGSFPDTLNREFTDLAFSLLGRGFGGVAINKTVINELNSTGSFSNIQNANLKKKIGNYYSFLNQRLEGYAIEEHEEWANETTRFLRDNYGIFTLDVSYLKDPIASLKNKRDVEYQLRYLALEVNYHCIWSIEAKEKASDLVRLIDEEVKRLKN
ncbi:DUF6090 family protein [Lutimonas zeaxanthinifaciens]|uniref:DUF6090 family protein n=1 Tax=Lutimonas zeaxanthinifaciens TaxID=3060215 RepID=UPI00265CA3E4|nr:DUF6090 family protein [Lutimonas sp. YSD2104]WKK66488.1 DUF6090 family protein [Lutimonas sp. YSD2104]